MKISINKVIFLMLIFFGLSCTKKLDKVPLNDLTSEQVYATIDGYNGGIAKVYGAFGLTGNRGPAGSADIQAIADEGFSDFFRLFWNMQELTTDEAFVCSNWGDAGIHDLHNMVWSSSNQMITGFYYRSMYQITLANEFIRQSEDGKISSRGFTGANADLIRRYRNEARYLRAFQYWVLMDAFGSPAFVTEENPIGSTDLPDQINRTNLFNYIESELLAIEPLLGNPRFEYARADKAAVWALLARMYLNAKVYTGTDKYTQAITYAQKVINAGYSLLPNYTSLFRADNDVNNTESIFVIPYDGLRSQSYGGATFLTHCLVGAPMNPTDFGVNGGWTGMRVTKNLPNKFPDPNGVGDKRAQFFTTNQPIDISTYPGDWAEGYKVTKFKNVKTANPTQPGSSLDYADMDIPLFRLGEMYLIYAEAVLRGGSGGSITTAVQYINNLRTRAQTSPIIQANLTLPFLIDELSRELYMEGHRRTDLVRFGQFTSNSYLWPWKGGVKDGAGVPGYKDLFPIPAKDVYANPKLTQNPGY
jgi:hypothetical protein